MTRGVRGRGNISGVRGREVLDGPRSRDVLEGGRSRQVLLGPRGGRRWMISPPEIANLELWLDASDESSLTKDGSNQVTAWADLSGNGYDFDDVTSTPVWEETGTANGRQCVFFSGGVENLAATVGPPSWLGGVDQTIFVAHEMVGPLQGGAPFLLGQNAVTGQQGIGLYSQLGASPQWRYRNLALGGALNGNTQTTTLETPLDTVEILTAVRDGGAGTSTVITEAGTDTQAFPFGGGSPAGGLATLAARSETGDNSGIWRISEIVCYDRTLTPIEISAVRNYLTTKWGI